MRCLQAHSALTFLLVPWTVLLVVPFAVADSPRKPMSPTPAEEFKALIAKVQAGQMEFSDAYQAAKTNEDRKKVMDRLGKKSNPQSYTNDFLDFIAKYAKDAVTIDCFKWLLLRLPYEPVTQKAADNIMQHHLQSDKMGALCQSLELRPCPVGLRILEAALEKNKSREVQGYGRYSVAQYHKHEADRSGDGNDVARQQASEKAESLLAEVIAKYADLKHYPSTLGKAADTQLFELRHLSIGKVAPEIEGEDIDGKKFKLSDYRGKVVLLDFWGHW